MLIDSINKELYALFDSGKYGVEVIRATFNDWEEVDLYDLLCVMGMVSIRLHFQFFFRKWGLPYNLITYFGEHVKMYFICSCCCCLPTPMTLASGGSPMFPLVVHQPASPSIWPAMQSLRRGLSANPGATMWCVCGCS